MKNYYEIKKKKTKKKSQEYQEGAARFTIPDTSRQLDKDHPILTVICGPIFPP